MQKTKRIIIAATTLTLLGAFALYRTSWAAGDDGSTLASGTVEATQADLGFPLAGRLESITVREGDNVSVGTELGALERTELLAQRAAAAAQLAGAEALLSELEAGSRREEIAAARAALDVSTARRDAARRDVERLRPLAEQSLVSRQAFDRQRTELEASEGAVAQAREQLQLLETGPRPERIQAQRATMEQARSAIARIDATLDQAVLRAPLSGTITTRHREPGEALSPGQPVVTIRDLDDRWVRIYVPGDEVGRLAIGERAEITGDADPQQTFAGVVSYIASVAEFTPRNVQTTKDRVKLVYEVRVRITNDSAVALKPGLPADVRFPPAGAR